ncbi:23S rRNA (cytosine1962-C5)-methyltransferase [Cnuella takakiae]|uniref:23S rRNA (Cytosine1962-C5)-methyltransferase n=1 Tax=Cnuella takakiae TaxID=1302690 RepID=A0A1M5IM68_9BACT|nr:class I SAM-dependent methyltransferase [Cnuella takakiae]OLY92240.1 SAM-dependent methyltransferase [Cnuella takakiae]SHG29408.1 23S rRNA (cytosine1962-C5)-methyltransferase [Cnuella takakiae]
MSQPEGKFLMFYNRLQKVYRHLSKQATRQGISCYRVYDHDLPEFPLLIEIFHDKLYVSEYKRRHEMEEQEHEAWLDGCKKVMHEVLGIAPENIFVKLRQRKTNRQGQYQKLDEQKNEFVVAEGGLQFLVNLTDYLDTGLFLDHRITRGMVREAAKDKRVLNLFCYTGSFSVYAAAGGAAQVVSVDLSKTYLDWAERNMRLNFPLFASHQVIHADVLAKLRELPAECFDLIVMDPPTFSNSKRMDGVLDIQRDHVQLISDCLRLLAPGGMLYFSTNFTKFKLAEDGIAASQIRDITKATTPFDFAGKLNRYCFKLWK